MSRLHSVILLAILGMVASVAATRVIGASEVTFYCAFSGSPTDCGFEEQAKGDRAALTSIARDGGTAVVLRTRPGDINVFGSGGAERNDLSLSQDATDCYQGRQHWWSHSIRFPDDYVVPPAGGVWHWGVVFDFHHTAAGGQANLQVVSLPKGLAFWVAGGPSVVHGPGAPGFHQAMIGPVVKNVWYDFVYNVKWSAYGDGFVKGWVNGELKLDYRGPTLYAGEGCYLKLANYHSALGRPVAVIHDRIVRGTSPYAVSSRLLEGVAD